MIRLIPTYTSLSSEGVARLFRDHVWKDFGLPESIIYDRGSVFVSRFMEALNHLLGIRANPSTAYHPQTDGQTERVNQEVEQYLRTFVNYHQDDWADWLSLAEFSHNDKVNDSTHYSPFYLNWGRHPRKGVEPRRETKVEAAMEFVQRMEGIRKEAAAALERAARDMKTFYDRHHQEAPIFQPGDEVLLEGENLRTNRPSKKLDHRRFGPFKVDKKIGERAYRLKLPTTWKIHPVFHVSKLLPYHRDDTTTSTPPPPDIVEGEPQQEIEDILDQRTRRGKLQFLVKWRGFPMEENEWKYEHDLEHAKELLDDFKSRPLPHCRPRKRRG
jgi:transposase InsO family protein